MTDVAPGQTWICTVANKDDPPEPHTESMWADYPQFRAVVDSVQDDYVELTVSGSDDHPRSPDFGADVVETTTGLNDKTEWRLNE